MKICKCGKKAVVALNDQWFCLDCFENGVKDVKQIIERSIKKAMEVERKRA